MNFLFTKNTFFLFFSLIFVHFGQLKGQPGLHECGTDHLHAEQFGRNLQYAQRQRQADALIYQQLRGQLGPSANRSEAATYTVPVVVHIMHRAGTPVGTGENLSDAQIALGIQHLNEAFRGLPPFNGPGAADVDVEFCLAKRDPLGGPTTGINRLAVPDSLTDALNSTYDLVLKNQLRWDPTRYVNIWLVKEIFMPGFGFGVAGYAYLAGAHGMNVDGIVNEARWFGSSPNGSKIHIHEMGHYLNLYHTFDGGCPNTNCLLSGDRVCDTPPDNSKAGVACASTVNTCTSDPDDNTAQNPFRPVLSGGLGDQPDLTNNYMDYGFQACQNAFTQGQKNRMVAALTGVRQSLIAPGNLACQPPCAVAVTSAFTMSPSSPVLFGTVVNFTNTSANATDYEWTIFREGAPVSSATTADHAYTFGLPGNYTVRLRARNLTPPNDTRCLPVESEQVVRVVCPAMSVNFTASATSVVAGTTVTFTNTTTGAASYEWLVNGVSFATTLNSAYAFNTQGSYTVRLRATDGSGICSSDQTATVVVTCPVSAFFTSPANSLFIGTNLSFTNTSVGASGYLWSLFANGSAIPVTTASLVNFSYLFATAGSYELRLVADNGTCRDTARQYLTVRDPDDCGVPGARIWLFGSRAGLDFNPVPPPVALNTVGSLFAPEGCASVTNEFGSLLFYTNGQTLYAQNHTVMLNGSGLVGSPQSVQSAQVVPAPGASNLFYLFTTDADGGQGALGGGGNQGLRASLIDMNANGGLGAVVTGRKNILLDNEASEKVIATMHGNGCDVWLVSHRWGTNEFRAYQVSSATDLGNPGAIPRQTSAVGSPVLYNNTSQNAPVFDGQMKISPDGQRLAFASVSRQNQGYVEFFDFDNLTGAVSNVRQIYSNELDIPYGVEFSPDGTRLYVTTYPRSVVSAGKPHLYQFNLLAGTAAAIAASRTELPTNNPDLGNLGLFGLQLAPDNKIYVATEDQRGGYNRLGVIQSPNVLGVAAGYQAASVGLGSPPPAGDEGPVSRKGLPAPVPANFIDFDFSYDCEAQRTRFSLNRSSVTVEDVIWDFGDGSVSNDVNPLHTYPTSGPYTVRLSVLGACACKTIGRPVSLPSSCIDLTPLRLADFRAFLQPNQQAVDLLWQTAWERGTSHFEVERSADGQDFAPVGRVRAQGESASRRDYAWADRLPRPAPVWYYRLRMVDASGEFAYSPIVVVYAHAGHAPMRAQPVPVRAGQVLWLTDSGLAGPLTVEWIDLPGRLVRRDQPSLPASGGRGLALSTVGLPAGVYLLRATGREGWVGQCKVVVE
jgi:PKD repeat protein